MLTQKLELVHRLSLAPANPVLLQPTQAAATDAVTRQTEEPSPPVDDHSTLGLIEMMLKSPSQVDRLVRHEIHQPGLVNGVRSLYVGFMPLVDALPPHHRCRRECLLRRLVFAWSACYTAVTPLMVYTLWNHFSA